MIGAIASQEFGAGKIDLVVVDNASTDGTLEAITERWAPDRIVDNPTDAAHEPAFALRECGGGTGVNRAGLHSLTVVRNTGNHGGCGGFNTGFAAIASLFGEPGASPAPTYVWLVDDDADLPPDALTNLISEMEADEHVGLVGSRAVSIVDKRTTIETTIYYDRSNGRMTPHAPPGHPEHRGHMAWLKQTGGTLGCREFSGSRPVDVVSACSMLSRWSAVAEVGFWDWRYFIYCDDADWCLRFARAGWKVVLSLDAVVYHTPWNLKITPARMYYAQRNAVWMTEKVLGGAKLKQVVTRWLVSLLREAFKAGLYRRLMQGEILRTTANDIASQVTGKTAPTLPPSEPVGEALARACPSSGRVLIVCAAPGSIEAADQVRASVGDCGIEWSYLVRSDFAQLVSGREIGERDGCRWIGYDQDRDGRIWAGTELARVGFDACVVLDFACDVGVPNCPWTLHVETRDPSRGRLERQSWRGVLSLWGKCVRTLARCVFYGMTVDQKASGARYG